MGTAVDKTDRVLLSLLGLSLVVVGAVGLALSFGAFRDRPASQPVLPEQVSDFADTTGWFWWAAAAACILVGVLALWWLLAQTRTDRVGHIDVTVDEADGTTAVPAGAVTSAVQEEVGSFLGVHRAAARIRGRSTHRLELVVDLDERADLAEIRRRVEQETAPRARQALDNPGLPVEVELRPATGQRSAPR